MPEFEAELQPLQQSIVQPSSWPAGSSSSQLGTAAAAAGASSSPSSAQVVQGRVVSPVPVNLVQVAPPVGDSDVLLASSAEPGDKKFNTLTLQVAAGGYAIYVLCFSYLTSFTWKQQPTNWDDTLLGLRTGLVMLLALIILSSE